MLSELLIGQLKLADELLIATPLYNFGMPSSLKAWVDHVVRSGETFAYTPEGLKGLLLKKRAYLVCVRGGVGATAGPNGNLLVLELETVLRFMGFSDIEVFVAEGTCADPAVRDKELAKARRQIDVCFGARMLPQTA